MLTLKRGEYYWIKVTDVSKWEPARVDFGPVITTSFWTIASESPLSIEDVYEVGPEVLPPTVVIGPEIVVVSKAKYVKLPHASSLPAPDASVEDLAKACEAYGAKRVEECDLCHRMVEVKDGKYVRHEWVPGNLASLTTCPLSGKEVS
jgi:hypothetical protein